MGYRFNKAKYMRVMQKTADTCSVWVDECDGQPAHFPSDNSVGVTTVGHHAWLISKDWCVKDDSFITGMFDFTKYVDWATSQDENWDKKKNYKWASASERQVCTFSKMEGFDMYHTIGRCPATDGLSYVVSQSWCDMGEEE